MNFAECLLDLYVKAAPRIDNLILPRAHLEHFLAAAERYYQAKQDPALLDKYLESLLRFTHALPRDFRVPVGETHAHLFTQTYPVIKDDDIDPDLQYAFWELKRPLPPDPHAAPEGYLPFEQPRPRFTEAEPIAGEQYSIDKRIWSANRREFRETQLEYWKEDKKRHDNLHAQVNREMSEWRKFFALTPLYWDPPILPFDVPFAIPPQRWFEGCWIVAPQGSGKTNLLRHLVLDRIKDDATIVLMDAKGDLLESFSHLRRIKDRLVIVEPQHISINPFELKHSLELLLYLFSVFNTDATPLQTRVLTQILRFTSHIPDATLLDFKRVLQYGWERYPDALAQLDEDQQHFFMTQWKTSLVQSRLPELLTRVDQILDHDLLKYVFLSQSSLDWSALLNSGKIICINLNENDLGKVGSEFFGRLILALTWHARRGTGQFRPAYFYIDEADVVIRNDRQVNEMIARLRSKFVSLTFAHQRLNQIDDEKVRGALGDCKIKFTNAIGEAAGLAYYFGQCDPKFISSLDVGNFVCHISPETRTGPVTLTVPFYPTQKPTERLHGYDYLSAADYQSLPRYKRARTLPSPSAPTPTAPTSTPKPRRDVG